MAGRNVLLGTGNVLLGAVAGCNVLLGTVAGCNVLLGAVARVMYY